MITSKNWAGEQLVLIDRNTNAAVAKGDIKECFRSEKHRITGGMAPHKPGSTGRVYCTDANGNFPTQFFPSVLNLIWAKPEEIV